MVGDDWQFVGGGGPGRGAGSELEPEPVGGQEGGFGGAFGGGSEPVLDEDTPF